MKVHKNVLAAKIAATNKANAYALKLYPILADFFKDYVGYKLEKVDGTLLKAVKDKMPAFPTDDIHGVYRHTSDYSLAWCVKTCESSPGRQSDYQIANYHEVVVYIGNMRDGVLTEISKPPTYLRTDFTAEEIETARETYRKAKAAVSEAQAGIHHFGEYDV